MLDKRLVYSCGYWKDAETLDEAQEAKLELICRKLQLLPGMRLLDIGCGWGGLLQFAAKNYETEGVGLTVSANQANYIRSQCRGYPIEVRLQDYRDIDEPFDRVVSVGMFEHVGYKNYGAYMAAARRCLKNGALSLLHTIGTNRSTTTTDPWIGRYIFPNSMLPSAQQIAAAAERHFVIEDWHNFGTDYDKTLMAWYDNFCCRWDEIKDWYGERFYRMWTFYLLSCAGTFRARKNQLWQVVLSAGGVPGGYVAPR